MPLPGTSAPPPVPSSLMLSRTGSAPRSTLISQRFAPLCRTTLVTPSRTIQASSFSACAVSCGPDSRTTGSILAAPSSVRARSSSSARLVSR